MIGSFLGPVYDLSIHRFLVLIMVSSMVSSVNEVLKTIRKCLVTSITANIVPVGVTYQAGYYFNSQSSQLGKTDD